MRRSKILSTLVIGATGLGVAACGSGDDGSGASATPSGGLVSVAHVGGADVLASSEGKTLYSADVEKRGRIRCTDACTSFWDPVAASSADAEKAADDLGAALAVVQRPDGASQLTFDGQPLYTFAEEGAGALEGDGFTDDFEGTHFEWQAARTSGGSPASSNGSRGAGGYGY
jgi:predicted lipoprotein with Yx(FWY)xxD motif